MKVLDAADLSGESDYGRVFWLSYLANASTMSAVSMLVRYADFITHLNGTEARLGLIVGVGMVWQPADATGPGRRH